MAYRTSSAAGYRTSGGMALPGNDYIDSGGALHQVAWSNATVTNNPVVENATSTDNKVKIPFDNKFFPTLSPGVVTIPKGTLLFHENYAAKGMPVVLFGDTDRQNIPNLKASPSKFAHFNGRYRPSADGEFDSSRERPVDELALRFLYGFDGIAAATVEIAPGSTNKEIPTETKGTCPFLNRSGVTIPPSAPLTFSVDATTFPESRKRSTAQPEYTAYLTTFNRDPAANYTKLAKLMDDKTGSGSKLKAEDAALAMCVFFTLPETTVIAYNGPNAVAPWKWGVATLR